MSKILRIVAILAVILGFGLGSASLASATTPSTQPYVTVIWTMPSWVDSTTPTWPQHLYAYASQPTENLNLALPTACGVKLDLQVDSYLNDSTTAALIKGGVLNGSNSPTEHLAPGGWGVAYKLVQVNNPACSTVSPVAPTIAPATCDSPSTIPALPANGNGITYTRTGNVITATIDSTKSVWSTALNGYTKTGDTTATYTFVPVGALGGCTVTVSPSIPYLSLPECTTTNGVQADYTISAPTTTGVIYEIGGKPFTGTQTVKLGSTVTVTAVPAAGSVFSVGATTSWTWDTSKLEINCYVPPEIHTTPPVVTPPTSTPIVPAKNVVATPPSTPPTTDLAMTGANPAPLAGLAIVLLIGGVGLLVMAARRKRA